jgi:hypothetical protein
MSSPMNLLSIMSIGYVFEEMEYCMTAKKQSQHPSLVQDLGI